MAKYIWLKIYISAGHLGQAKVRRGGVNKTKAAMVLVLFSQQGSRQGGVCSYVRACLRTKNSLLWYLLEQSL